MPEADLVTKADLDSGLGQLKAELTAEMTELNQKIEDSTKRLALEILKTNGRIDRLDGSLRGQMESDTRRILKAIDDFAGKAEKYDRSLE
jgi:hypothetical protein